MDGVILVLGGRGQLGAALARARRSVVAVGRDVVDVRQPRAVAVAVARWRPVAVVNAAAWTAVDAAERAPGACFAVNADGAGHVARACAAARVPLLHVSTDYVFDGAHGPYAPGDPVRPRSVYGRSKAAGEEQVRSAGGDHVILRTSWVLSGTHPGFATAIVRRARAGTPLRVVDDQRGQPTPAALLARAVLAIVDARSSAPWGTWHAAGAPATTWCGLARALVAADGRRVPVGAIPTGAWPAAAARPADGRLDTSAFDARFGVDMAWHPVLPALVREVA